MLKRGIPVKNIAAGKPENRSGGAVLRHPDLEEAEFRQGARICCHGASGVE